MNFNKCISYFLRWFFSFYNLIIFSLKLNPKIKNILYYKISQNLNFFFSKRLYRGVNNYCPCCEHSYESFLPYGVEPNRRANALCPGCGSLERHRLIWLFLKEKKSIFKERIKVLHFGPQYILFNKLKHLDNLTYLSADLFREFVDYRINICEIDFKDNIFDAIICIHIFQFVKDDIKAFSELFRILKPGGWAIIQTQIDSTLRSTLEVEDLKSDIERKRLYGLETHVRRYGRDYKLKLESVGFNVEEINYVSKFNSKLKNILGLNMKYGQYDDCNIYYCRKPIKRNKDL